MIIIRRDWTKKEEQYLLDRYIKQPIKTTARALNRTELSIKHKAAQLGINKRIDLFGIRTFARYMGVDNSVILRWIEKFDMPVNNYKFDKHNHYDVDLEKFWQWAEEHKELINWSKYECGSLALEPEWVRFEKQMYATPMTREKWTSEDLRMLKKLLHLKKTYAEIATEMGRTYDSIKHIMRSGKVY